MENKLKEIILNTAIFSLNNNSENNCKNKTIEC